MVEPVKPSELKEQIYTHHGMRYALIYEGESLERMRKGDPLVVLVPGVPSSARDFRHLAPVVNTWAPVVRVIWSGFGILHDELEAPSSTQERAQYLSMIADAEGWNHYLMIGHSLGGVAVLAHAVQDHRIAGLGLLASVGVSRHRGLLMDSSSAKIWIWLSQCFIFKPLIRVLFAWGMQRSGFRGHPFHLVQIQLILHHVKNLSFAENLRYIELLSHKTDFPIGHLYTLDDPIVDAEASRTLGQALCLAAPQTVSTSLAQGGHNPQRNQIFETDQWLRARYRETLQWIQNQPH